MVLKHGMGTGRAAFTLLELMVVCVVIGIMTAMILPEMRGTFEEARLRSGGRRLLSVFQLARSRAIILRESQRVRFDEASGRCYLERKARPEEGAGGYVSAGVALGAGGAWDRQLEMEFRRVGAVDETADGEWRRAGEGGDWGSELVEAITFYADGTADAGEIVLRDRQGFRLGLRVHGATGRVELRELGRE